ncbi:hypothetical protein AQUCO_05300072v1 [Aquilegia coerulea]|uniref:U6 snRNA phosphodiesterase n=1 Tax=Aquilegia coerulea TaxID=218851 RepID=A0A2G5CI87_AQUCA|nr:hypothetical protein AQUCO_05300072v1 [Aquilegia coerulea]
MEALVSSYGESSSSDSDSDSHVNSVRVEQEEEEEKSNRLPPPPLDLLNPPNSLDCLQTGNGSRVRSFPHVEGNYALHVSIPVHIPSTPGKELARLFKRIACVVPDLYVVDADIPLNVLCKDDQKLEQVGLGREFHISLGRTVPIRVHQIESIVTMLRQRLQSQKRYWIDFSKLEVFVNDDHTRTFLSLEITSRGLAEITKQIQSVNEIYRLHNLPEFYKDPRPHISLAWAVGDINHLLKRHVEEEMRRYCSNGGSVQKLNFTCQFSGIECKIRLW